ncbi:MAG: energy transducer TonB [Candidatus Cyclobacteriaceae bacterium M2_1C_046]
MAAPKHHTGIPIKAHLKVTHKKNQAPLITADTVDDLIQFKRQRYRQNKINSFLYFTIGLTITLSLIIYAFEYKVYMKGGEIEITEKSMVAEEILDIPPTEQPPPEPPKVIQQPNFTVVTEEEIVEEIEVNFDIEMTEETTIEETFFEITEGPKEEVAEEIFTIVEQPPTPQGGMGEFMSYLQSNLRYPPAALRLGVEGKVFVQFIVNPDGSLTDFELIRGIGAGCDEEAIRVLKNSPNWNPGKQRGKAVKVRMILPVFFIIKK